MLIRLPPHRRPRARGRRPRGSRAAPRAARARAPSASALPVSSLSSRTGSPVSRTTSSPFAPVADLRDPRVADQLGRRPLPHDRPVAEDRDSIGELLRLVEVVRRQQDRRAERPERADHLPGCPSRGGIEARGRLVQEHEVGVADEGHAEIEPTLLAAGERLHARVPLLAEPDEVDHLVDVARVRVVARRRAGGFRGPSGSGSAPTAAERRRCAPAALVRRSPGSCPSTEASPPSRLR